MSNVICPEMETNRSVLIEVFKLRKSPVEIEPFLYFHVFVSGKELVDLCLCFQSLLICSQFIAIGCLKKVKV